MKQKQIILSFLTVLAVSVTFFIACTKKAAQNPSTHNTPVKKFDFNLSLYPDLVNKSDANIMISAYANDNSKLSQSSFLYDPTELLNYINNAPNIQYLHIFLGEKVTTDDSKQLTLIFSGIDNNGNHIYVSDANNNPCVLDHVIPCPVCVQAYNDGSNIETPSAANSSYTANYTQNLRVTTAQTWISNYINNSDKNTTATSFYVDASVIADYLNNATGINKVHFLLAENGNGQLTLIISGVDNNSNHIYITDNDQNYFVLDHAMPCPVCSTIANNGVDLE